VERTPVKTLEYLSGEHFDPFSEVLLNETFPSEAKFDSRSEAKILKYGNQDVRIRASSTNPGVLVLADSFYPGWHVYVDGKEQRLLRANYFFRAVRIGQGEHIVEFKYEPYWFKIGKLVSIATLTTVVMISMFLVLKPRWQERWVNGSLETPSVVRFAERFSKEGNSKPIREKALLP
jgi:hypothetical protein